MQVQRIEGEATPDEVIGEFGVKEVVGESVHQQYRVPDGGPVLTGANQRGDEFALPVRIDAEPKGLLPVAGSTSGSQAVTSVTLTARAGSGLAPTAPG